MYVRDLVSGQRVVTVAPRDEVGTAIRLLFKHNIGGMPVVAPDGVVVGFIGERDIVKTINSHLGPVRHMLVQDAMSPAAFCDPDDSVEFVMRKMTNERVRHLDRRMYIEAANEAQAPSPALAQYDRLKSAFGG